MINRKIICLCAAASIALGGCADNSTPVPAEGSTAAETETAETSAVSETSAETAEETVFETEAQPVSYPCLYEKSEMKCCYDDKEIYGNIFIPQNGKEIHPAVILSHGYNSIGADMTDVAEKLAENGVVSYTYDFCGGSTRSKSSGNSTDMSVETEQDNLRHVIEMIKDLDSVDSENIYLYGESQGGFVSALTGAEMKDDIAGMFLIYPAFCIPDDWLGRNEEEMTATFNFMGLEISKAFYDGVPRYDVFEHVSQFDKPVKIYHGDKDPVVNLSYSQRLAETFPDVTLTVVEGGGHGFSGVDRLTLKKEIADYFISGGLV